MLLYAERVRTVGNAICIYGVFLAEGPIFLERKRERKKRKRCHPRSRELRARDSSINHGEMEKRRRRDFMLDRVERWFKIMKA